MAQQPSSHSTVVLLSIDGLMPEQVFHASEHGLKLPNLTRLVNDGVSASSVKGVLPTLTYPSHTTILTGVSPAKHGIVANTTFDPLNKNEKGWYWYAEDIKVPTLWDASHAAGLKTANVYWPVSVGANIDYNLPQIWRTGEADDLKLQRVLSTSGLEQELVAKLGRYPGGMEETVKEDELRVKFAISILQSKKPSFMTVYVTGLDTEQHKSGPYSAASNAVLERLDAIVGELRQAVEAIPGKAYLCIVSDHGFASIHHDVNLYAAFLEAGLFSVEPTGNIKDWKAMPWPAGAAAAIVVNKNDPEAKKQVYELLSRLATDPVNGIDRIVTRDELEKAGAFPTAEYLVSFKIGYELGFKFAPPLISAPPLYGGMHGYLPENPEMRSVFFLVGTNVASGKSVGEIDMRQIAPTIADILKVKLPDVEMQPLNLR